MKKTTLCLALCLTASMGFSQIIYTMAGNGTSGYTGNGGLAQSAELNGPMGVAGDANGNIYIADHSNNVVRKVAKNGVITTIAGTGVAGYSGNGGAATSAQLDGPTDVALDPSGNIYIADEHNNVIRKITVSTGIISTFAGTQYIYSGNWAFGGDGFAATSAFLAAPWGIVFDASGNLYIADSQNHRVRIVNTSGIINTFAGGGTGGLGDGGAATSARLDLPVAVETHGTDLYIADAGTISANGANRVRKVTSGNISTVAGNGTAGFSGNGSSATSAMLNSPYGVAVDASGVLYIADLNNFEVRKVASGIINAYAGTHTQGFSNDGGLATSANIDVMYGLGIAVDGSGYLYVPDNTSSRIRAVGLNCPANAGPNKTNTCGSCCATTSVTIGTPSVTNMNYAWTCSGTCNLWPNASSAQPTAAPCNLSTPTTYTVSVSNANCTTSTSTMTVTSTAPANGCCRLMGGSNQFQEPVAFNVFPNPTSGSATVTLYAQAEYLRIFDVSGKMVFEAKDVTESEVKVDVSKYNKGVYFVVAKIGSTFEKQKLVIE